MILCRCLLLVVVVMLIVGLGFGYMCYWELGWFELIYQCIVFFKDKVVFFKIFFLVDFYYFCFVSLSLIFDVIVFGIE